MKAVIEADKPTETVTESPEFEVAITAATNEVEFDEASIEEEDNMLVDALPSEKTDDVAQETLDKIVQDVKKDDEAYEWRKSLTLEEVTRQEIALEEKKLQEEQIKLRLEKESFKNRFAELKRIKKSSRRVRRRVSRTR